MLFNLLFMGTALLIPIAAILAYRQGLKDGRTIRQDKTLAPILKLPKAAAKISREDKHFEAILRNIDSYSGTAAGQKEV